MLTTIGIDVGGTKAIAVAGGPDGSVRHRIYRAHGAAGPGPVLDLIADLIRDCADASGHEPLAIGLSVAGWLAPDRDRVLVAANLGLVDDPLPCRVAARIGRAVVMENDGNAAAVAESRFGAAYGSRVSMTLTIGTGVGGGVVIRNELLTGGRGLAGELGHLSVDPDGPRCACGGVGCLEAYACGPAIVRAAAAAGLMARTSADVVAAAESGDAAATAAIHAAAAALGHGIAHMCAVVDPEVVVVGGGVTAGAGELFLDPVRRAVATHLPLRAVVTPPRVEAATTGPAAGAIGAAALAWDALDEGSLE